MKTTKAILLLLIIMLLSLLAACGGNSDQIDPAPVFVREDYFVTSEFGETHYILVNEGPFRAYIRYPQGGGVNTDRAIADWADAAYEAAIADFTQIFAEDENARGELNIQFDSHMVRERFAGVIKRGYFTHSHLDTPIYIAETFNIDTAEDILLANEDILDFGQSDFILGLLREKLSATRPDAAPFLDDMDASWLSYLAVSQDALLILLARGEFLPTEMGSVTLALPYEMLGTAFLLWDAYGSPHPEPTPSPTSPTEPTRPPQITPIQPPGFDPDRPMVALTFDDGPSRYTDDVLDLLEQHGGRATFMVLGNLIDARRDTVVRAVELGNEVIGHSWDHRDLTKLSEQEVISEIYDTSALIASVTGVSQSMFRPPYGAYNDKVKRIAAELGYSIIYWSVDTLDWRHRDPDWVYNAIMNDVMDGSVILLHDIHGTTAEAMISVIPRLIEEGFQLVTISELLHHRYGDLEPGRVYYGAR